MAKVPLVIEDYGKKSVRKYTSVPIRDERTVAKIVMAFECMDDSTLSDILYDAEDLDFTFLYAFDCNPKTLLWSLQSSNGLTKKGKCKISLENVLDNMDSAIEDYNKRNPHSDYVLIAIEDSTVTGYFEVPENIDMSKVQFDTDGIVHCMGPWIIDENYKKVFGEKAASVSCFKYNGKYYFGDIEEGFTNTVQFHYAFAYFNKTLSKWKIAQYFTCP